MCMQLFYCFVQAAGVLLTEFLTVCFSITPGGLCEKTVIIVALVTCQ